MRKKSGIFGTRVSSSVLLRDCSSIFNVGVWIPADSATAARENSLENLSATSCGAVLYAASAAAPWRARWPSAESMAKGALKMAP